MKITYTELKNESIATNLQTGTVRKYVRITIISQASATQNTFTLIVKRLIHTLTAASQRT